MWLDSNNGNDKNKQRDVTKQYKWMPQSYRNRREKTIQMDVTKLYKWMWENSDKTLQIDLTKLYKSVEHMDMIRL